MTEYQSIDQMSRKARLLWAAVCIVIGVAAVVSARVSGGGETLAATLAGAAFVFAGLAIAAYSKRDPSAYHWLVALLLGCMLGILVWLVFGGGERSCGFPLPFWGQDLPCRVVAGIAALLMGLVLAIAVKQALAARAARD